MVRARRSRRLSPLASSEKAVGRALILPGRLLLLGIVAFPVSIALYIACTEWTPTSGDLWYQAYRSWEWFDQYQETLTTAAFWSAIWRSVLVTAVAVTVEFLAGFLLALLLARQFRGRAVLTASFLLPMMVVPAVSGFIFSMLLQVDGPVNAALSSVLPGDVTIPWLSDPGIAIWSLVLVDVWQWTPLMFLIFLAGLLALPEDQLNQARLLGAGSWHQVRLLILPLLKPVIVVALIIRAVETFKMFDAAWTLNQGGPGESTTTISVLLFRQTFQGTRWGFAAAMAILVLVLVSLAALRAVRPIERAQSESMDDLVGDRGTATTSEPSSDEREPRLGHAELPSSHERAAFTPPPRRSTWRRARPAAARWIVIAVLWAAFMFPLYWTATTALKPAREWTPLGHVFWAPENPTLANFKEVLGVGTSQYSRPDAIGPLKNSLIAATGGTLFAVLVGTLAAYGMGRFRAGGRLFAFQILQLRMLPPIAIMIPLLVFFAYVGLTDKLHGLVIAYAAITFPLAVWLMRSFFAEVPKEISEAAVADGCTHWGALVKTVLPQVKGGIAVTALFLFILNWSDFLIAFTLSAQELVTAPMQLNVMQTVAPARRFGPESALAMVLVLPPALFGLAIQRYLVRGLTFGAVRR